MLSNCAQAAAAASAIEGALALLLSAPQTATHHPF